MSALVSLNTPLWASASVRSRTNGTAHDLVHPSTIQAAGQAADVIVEMTGKCNARPREFQPIRKAIDVAVQGLHHAENELAHGFTAPQRCPTGFLAVLDLECLTALRRSCWIDLVHAAGHRVERHDPTRSGAQRGTSVPPRVTRARHCHEWQLALRATSGVRHERVVHPPTRCPPRVHHAPSARGPTTRPVCRKGGQEMDRPVRATAAASPAIAAVAPKLPLTWNARPDNETRLAATTSPTARNCAHALSPSASLARSAILHAYDTPSCWPVPRR